MISNKYEYIGIWKDAAISHVKCYPKIYLVIRLTFVWTLVMAVDNKTEIRTENLDNIVQVTTLLSWWM
jgi:hypothetical protein